MSKKATKGTTLKFTYEELTELQDELVMEKVFQEALAEKIGDAVDELQGFVYVFRSSRQVDVPKEFKPDWQAIRAKSATLTFTPDEYKHLSGLKAINMSPLYRFRLTGNEDRDVEFVDAVETLVEANHGDFNLEYAHKDLYCFFIGGEFFDLVDRQRFMTKMSVLIDKQKASSTTFFGSGDTSIVIENQ
jgi:hypothetical protein